MMSYYAKHIIRLQTEAASRFERLSHALDVGGRRGEDAVAMSGIDVRLAVDDFKNILSEIRKLK